MDFAISREIMTERARARRCAAHCGKGDNSMHRNLYRNKKGRLDYDSARIKIKEADRSDSETAKMTHRGIAEKVPKLPSVHGGRSVSQPAKKTPNCHSEGRVLPEESAFFLSAAKTQIPRVVSFNRHSTECATRGVNSARVLRRRTRSGSRTDSSVVRAGDLVGPLGLPQTSDR
jgi:hypothetical protein